MGVSLPTPPLADNITAPKGAALLSLASAVLASNAVPTNSVRDASRIAIAATQGVDYLVTWNVKHINNASTCTMIVAPVHCLALHLVNIRVALFSLRLRGREPNSASNWASRNFATDPQG